jgi:hypothetical protein
MARAVASASVDSPQWATRYTNAPSKRYTKEKVAWQRRAAGRNDVKNLLRIGMWGRDYAQNLAGRRELLVRLE